MSTVFKWVHLSDIHFQSKDNGIQTDMLKNKLLPYLHDNCQGCNALILSGDYRFAPTKEKNPQKCAEYIIEIAKNAGLENNQIVAVPGNHDLERRTTRNYLINGILEDYDPYKCLINDECEKQLRADFTYYYALSEIIEGINSLKMDQEGSSHGIVHLNECDVLLLNTAITSGKDNERGRLVIGASDLNTLVNARRPNFPLIAVGHHSLTELNKEEQKSIEKIFRDNGVCLYLCGHAHNPEMREIGNSCLEITVGCIKQEGNDVMATFSIGEIDDNGDVKIISHKWDPLEMDWFEDPPRKRICYGLCSQVKETKSKQIDRTLIKKVDNPLTLDGFMHLDNLGFDGIKYFWLKDNKVIESVALNKRLKGSDKEEDIHTSAYTISTSIGCQLASYNKQCRFCGTGTLPYSGPLNAKDIALQCVFMAEYDMNCSKFPFVQENAREFAFMGQGEPGLNYAAIRGAIQLTDNIMETLSQKVTRYIISSCGVTDFMPELIDDIRNNTFKNKVTVHFSLHETGKYRRELMPIDDTYDYKEFIKYCKLLYGITKEKIGVGILMFDQYKPVALNNTYTLTRERLEEILSELDNNVFRIDLCAVNNTSAGSQDQRNDSYEKALELKEVVDQKGFESKVFTSFGDARQSGCGMLQSDTRNKTTPGQTSIIHFNKAVELVNEAVQDNLSMLKSKMKTYHSSTD